MQRRGEALKGAERVRLSGNARAASFFCDQNTPPIRGHLVGPYAAPFSSPLAENGSSNREVQPISKKRTKERLTVLEAAGAAEGLGGPARRGADAEGAAAETAARSSWAKAPAIRAITRTSKVTSLNIVDTRMREEKGG